MNTIEAKKQIMPKKPIKAQEILKRMLESRNIQEANSALRREFILRQRVNNNMMQRDRLLTYVDENVYTITQEAVLV